MCKKAKQTFCDINVHVLPQAFTTTAASIIKKKKKHNFLLTRCFFSQNRCPVHRMSKLPRSEYPVA